MAFFSVSLFDITGQTQIKQLSNAYNKTFNDDLNGEGSFSFTIPNEFSSDITIGKIVKFSYGNNSDDYVFAGVIENIKRNITNTDNILEISGRGIKSLLESAIIYDTDRIYDNKNVGFIFKELFDEAQTRGALDGFTITFDDLTDSNNENWTTNEEIYMEEKIGTTLFDIINRHQDYAIYSRILPDMTINYYINIGTDRTIGSNPMVFRVGQNVAQYEKTIEGPIKNAIIGTYGENNLIVEDTDTTSINNNGRFETYISLSNIIDDVSAEKALNKTLEKTKTLTTGATIELTQDSYLPYIDFFIGDTILVADEVGNKDSYIVRSLTISESDNGSIIIVPELGTIKAQFEERIRRLISKHENKTAGGNSDGIASAPNIDGYGIAEGGGTEIYEGEVLTYDYANDTGTADVAAIEAIDPANNPINFTNSSGDYLSVGDIVTISTLSSNDPLIPDEYIATGIKTRNSPNTENFVYEGDVLTYNHTTKTGTADVAAIETKYPALNPITFTNGTGQYLAVNDKVLIKSLFTNSNITPNSYVAIGITQRAGVQTPIDQPIGELLPDFPLNDTTLPNPFYATLTEDGWNTNHDYNDYLGQGADTILGVQSISTAIRGFSRDTQTSFDLGVPPGGQQSNWVIFSDGRLFTFGSSALYERNPSTGTWTTHSFGTSGLRCSIVDYSNNWIWIYSAGSTAPTGGPFWSYGPSDTAPVSRGNLGTTLTVGTNDTTVKMAAGDGKLLMQFNDAETTGFRLHYKNSANGNNFAYDYITNDYIINERTNDRHKNIAPLCVVKSDYYWYLTQYTANNPDEVAINKFDYSNGVITTYLTGIEWTTATAKLPYGYTISTAGLHCIVTGYNDGTYIRAALATNNLSTTQYTYIENTIMPTTSITTDDDIGAPVEVAPNVIYFSVGDNGTAGNYPANSSYTIGVNLT